ncbi:2,3-cyclic-nucleotide 2-phosphodiesterase [Paecilomyces variotii No. 5]|uniref:2,3-cyclic-nucleotide 2-phosphodiesterase n=1 Tax=Byssochlamys spectabilis (strain No. 5 / NBRC 109023) TaxID=1356009 RepID=V5I623_BYSSN|nr:2,3-cyclic-nucleotide 2-phosphodiesterase [Paecilomyces variotii No. 5]
MRLAEDLEVANATADGYRKTSFNKAFENDEIVRGGHVAEIEGDMRIVKSGTDWKELSVVCLTAKRNKDGIAYVSNLKLQQYTGLDQDPDFASVPSCPDVPRILASVQESVTSLVRQPLLHTITPLDGRSWAIRSQETNLGNMLADAFRAFYETDIALVNSGSIRCDRILRSTLPEHSPHMHICPFDNAFVVKKVSGSTLLEALENSVSDIHTDGRFLQCSGLRLVASWKAQQGRRILEASFITSSGTPRRIEQTRKYTVAMVSFIASGFDGYTCFKDEETVVSEEGAMTDTSLLLQIFGYETRDQSGCEILIKDSTADAISRARAAIVVGHNDRDHLPIIGPALDGRIKFLDGPAL